MGDAGRHMGLIGGRMHGRAFGAFAGGKRNLFAKQATAPPSDWDADFLAFWERTSGTMNDDWKSAYNCVFQSLKENNIYSKFEQFLLYASENESDARINLISSSYGASVYNSPTFSKGIGFIGNGVNAYIDSNYNVVTAAMWQRNNACISEYIKTYGASSNFNFGSYTGSASHDYFEVLSGTYYGGINVSGYDSTIPVGSGKLHALSRNDASNYLLYTNKNSTIRNVASGMSSVGFNALSLAFNNSGTATRCNTSTVSAKTAGNYLSKSELDVLQDIIDTFLTAVSTL